MIPFADGVYVGGGALLIIVIVLAIVLLTGPRRW